MRIDSLHPDSDVILSVGNEPALIATFTHIDGKGEERVAWFISTDGDTEELYRWAAKRHNKRWVTGPQLVPLKLVGVIRDPRFPEVDNTSTTTVQYGFQRTQTSNIDWDKSKEESETLASKGKGRVVYRTVTYGEIQH